MVAMSASLPAASARVHHAGALADEVAPGGEGRLEARLGLLVGHPDPEVDRAATLARLAHRLGALSHMHRGSG